MKWLLFAWQNVRRNRRRSFTALLIVALGTAAVLIGGGFALFTYRSLREVSARDTGHVILAAADYFDGDEDTPMQNGLAGADQLATRMAALPGVRGVLPRIQFSGLISNGDKTAIFLGTGIVPETDLELRGPQMRFAAGDPFTAGAASPEVVIGTELARQMKAHVGSSLTLLATTTEGSLNAVDVTVCGIASVGVPDLDKRLVLADIAAVQRLLLTNKVSTLSVYLRNTDDTEAMAARLHAEYPQLAVRRWVDLATFYHAVRDLYNRIFGVIGLIMITIVAFAMTNTMSMAVTERTREVGTLRAIGTHRLEIVRGFVLEGGIIGVVGAIAGMLVAAGTMVWLMFAGIQMPPPPGRSNGYPLQIDFSPTLYAVTAAAVVLVAMGAAFFASARAARKPITDALAHV